MYQRITINDEGLVYTDPYYRASSRAEVTHFTKNNHLGILIFLGCSNGTKVSLLGNGFIGLNGIHLLREPYFLVGPRLRKKLG